TLELAFAHGAGGRGLLGKCAAERGLDRGDAGAVVLDYGGQPLREIDVAQEPDQPVEQKVLHRGVEIELQLAGDPVVELVDLAVERGHVVAVAYRGKRRRNAR